MEAATDQESVAAFAEETLVGTGWKVDSVRHRVSRVDPPNSYWSVFAVDIYKDEAERSLRLVARGALNAEAWEHLSARLTRHGAGNPCDPINGLGYPRLFPETQHAYWYYPFDPSMPNLPLADDPTRMAGVLFGLDKTEDMQAAARNLVIERVRYLPELGAILRYTIDVGGTPIVMYGKVQPGRRGLRTNRIVEGLWRASARYPGYLNLPRPLGYVEEMGMLIEEGIRGKPLSSKRTSTEFMLVPEAAAEALAVIHESRVESDEEITIDAELARLDKVADKFKYVHPDGHFLLKDLLSHMRERVQKTAEEERLPTHGDFKYDQFMLHNDQFTLLDFDYYATAETSYDLGKFCAYLVPSRPKDWRDSVAVEEARVRFVRRYRELRPHATLQRFAVYEALQFGLRAMSAMWMQKPGWHRLAETYLVLGFERLKSRLPE
ncbi:MAG TPA: phosphotransferase [Candidatus Limnocylindrales bacterium]|nr:phosphotransferase [Candidatus Limnocylindrales bacterium]